MLYINLLSPTGVILSVLATGAFPCKTAGSTLDRMWRLIVAGHIKHIIRHSRGDLSESLLDLIATILKAAPADRPSLDEILRHPWMEPEETAPHHCHHHIEQCTTLQSRGDHSRQQQGKEEGAVAEPTSTY